MLRIFLRRSTKHANFSSVQLCNNFSSKNSENTNEFPSKAIELDPIDKIKRCLKRDVALMKKKIMFWKEPDQKYLDPITKRVIDWDDPNAPIFPNHVDIVIIGGGVMGCSAAYWCKSITKDLRVVVIEKDPTYKEASTVLSVGGLRQQFSLEENIEMSLFGAEFIRNANDYLGIDGEPPVEIPFHPHGYLSLATAESEQVLRENSKLQNSMGARNVLLNASQLKSRFPWLTTDDIALGCLGLEKEGWFDPWSLLYAFKRKATSMGVEFITATAKGFAMKVDRSVISYGAAPGTYKDIDYLIVETEDGKLRPITFSKCIVAAGAFSANIAKMADIGYGEDILSVPLPVEPRKRFVYCFHAPDGPLLNIPMTIDPSGVYFRREGLDNTYICGRCPREDEEPSIDNLDVDPEFFEQEVWPYLAKRVNAFENLKVRSSWAGFYEYNTFDENGIIGPHPYHDKLLFATGFSGHGIQQAPAVGRALSELIQDSTFKTINLQRLTFDRFITLEPMREKNIW